MYAELERTLENFVSSPANDLLVLKGPWGVGKTFLWKRVVGSCIDRGRFKMKGAAYVSLFGLHNLSDLRTAILEESLRAKFPNLETQGVGLFKRFLHWLRSLGNIFSDMPYIGGFAKLTQAIPLFHANNILICFDDIERKSKTLSASEFLGICSDLKENRNCKIAIILNLGEVNKDFQDDFAKYREKIVDLEVLYNPTPIELLDSLGMHNKKFESRISEYANQFDINNIRIIQKISKNIEWLLPHLKGFHPRTLEYACYSMAILTWSYWSPKNDSVPKFDWLEKYNEQEEAILETIIDDDDNKSPGDEQQRLWRSLLFELNWYPGGTVQAAICFYLRNGFIKESILKQALENDDQQKIVLEARDEFRNVYKDEFWNGFQDNEQTFVEQLVCQYKKNSQFLEPDALIGLIDVLRKLSGDSKNYAEEIETCISAFEENFLKSRIGGDIDNIFIHFHSIDDELKERFRLIVESEEKQRDIGDVLRSISENRGWSKRDELFLAKFSVDEYYDYFKQYRGEYLFEVCREGLKLKFGGEHSEDGLTVSEKIRDALERIGKESAIDQLRVNAIMHR